MFAASFMIITAALIILGFFLLIMFNIDENIKALDEIPQLQVYCRYDIGEREIRALEDEIRGVDGIKEILLVSKDEAYSRARELLGENSAILDGVESDFLPVSFILKLDDPSRTEAFVSWLETSPYVEKISYPKKTIDLISKISAWTKAFGALLAGMPILLAVFIVSNTIRLAVIERRGEIGIMRYIGATEQLIRWPFIVEGMITGIAGAAVALIATGYGYRFVENSFNLEISGLADGLIRLVESGSATAVLLPVYLLVGAGVGAAGSARSIRRYLKV